MEDPAIAPEEKDEPTPAAETEPPRTSRARRAAAREPEPVVSGRPDSIPPKPPGGGPLIRY